MSALILLVDGDRKALRRTEALLSEAGYLVAAVSSFPEAKRLLDAVNPDLLVAGVRLKAFSGLHLAARGRLDHPKLPIIIINPSPDAILEDEVKRLGASFMVNPLENPEFLPAVRSAVIEHRQAQPRIRRWPRKQVSGNVEAWLPTSRARILDLSYGGLRLAFDEQCDLPPVFDVTLPTAGVTVRAHRVWTGRSGTSDEFWCGVELDTGAAPRNWRVIVDAVNEAGSSGVT